METAPNDLVTAFANELKALNNMKPPISRSKIHEVSRAALKAKDEYKHVVHAVEKFLPRCRPEHKISIAYIIDSVIRGGKHQLKEKDVYAKRFLGVFIRIMPMILDCNPVEQLRIVRTMNLWIANGIYKEEDLAEVKEAIRAKGIVTDSAEVERLVKGEKANMNLYAAGSSRERRHRNSQGASSSHHRERPHFVAHTPPGPPPSHLLDLSKSEHLSQSPEIEQTPEQREDLSDEIPEGGISERVFLGMIIENNVDYGGSFSTDKSLLKRAHTLICDKLRAHEEDRRKNHSQSIKNLLKYDYSDDEDDKKDEDEDPYVPLTLDLRFRIANNLINSKEVQDSLLQMHKERMDALNQIANQAKQKNLAGSGLLMPVPPMQGLPFPGQLGMQFPDQFGLPFPDQMGMPPPPISNMSNLQGLQGNQMPNLQGLPGNFRLPPPVQPQGLSQPMNFSLSGGFPSMGQSDPGPNNLLNSFLPQGHLMNLGQMHMPPATQSMLNLLGNGMDFQRHQDLLQGPMFLGHPLGMPSNMNNRNPPMNPNINPSMNPNMNIMNPPPGNQFHQIQSFPPVVAPDEDLRMPRREQLAGNDRNRRRRSRSRDRGDHKKSRRSRSRDRDNSKRQPETEEQKKKRKMGFPTMVFPEKLNVVSRTLWFGKLPSNCTDREIQEAVRMFGSTTNINIIPSKACAYVVMENRKSANDLIKQKSHKPIRIRERELKISYSLPPSITNEEDKASWDQEKGYLFCAWPRLPNLPLISSYFEGAQLDIATLPPHLQGVIDEFAYPVEVSEENTEESMEMSPSEMTVAPNFSLFPSMMGNMGLQPSLPNPQSLMGNPMLLPQQHGLLGGMNAPLPQGLTSHLPPNSMPPNLMGMQGMHPGGLPGAPLPLMRQSSNNQQFGGMPIPSLGSAPQQQFRGPPPQQNYDNPNREPLGGPQQFRGGFRGNMRGRGGGDRGGFHGNRGGFRSNNWNDRPPREDFRRDQGDSKTDRPDFGRGGNNGGDRRDWEEREPRRDYPPREEQGENRRREGGGRRRESRWGSCDDRDEPMAKTFRPDAFTSQHQLRSSEFPERYNSSNTVPIPPDSDIKTLKLQPLRPRSGTPPYEPHPIIPIFAESVVSSTTTEAEPQYIQKQSPENQSQPSEV